jgi:hypothetical protein
MILTYWFSSWCSSKEHSQGQESRRWGFRTGCVLLMWGDMKLTTNHKQDSMNADIWSKQANRQKQLIWTTDNSSPEKHIKHRSHQVQVIVTNLFTITRLFDAPFFREKSRVGDSKAFSIEKCKNLICSFRNLSFHATPLVKSLMTSDPFPISVQSFPFKLPSVVFHKKALQIRVNLTV